MSDSEQRAGSLRRSAGSAIDHLATNRGLILKRAVLASLMGMLPVPYVDDLLAAAVRGALVRRIAEIRGVDVDASAVETLKHPHNSRLLGAAGLGALAVAGGRRSLRRIAASLLMVRRVDEALQTWQVGTLFDHYCARHHVGFGLDGEKASALRGAIDQAIRQARVDSVRRAFARALRVSSGIAWAVPKRALALWSRRRGGPIKPERIAPAKGSPVVAPSGMVGRAARALEAELAGVERAYLTALTERFDAALAALAAPSGDAPR
jgi:hypothetical protein